MDENTHSVFSTSWPGDCACSCPILENEELNEAGARAAVASSGCSLRPGAYIRTNSRILEKSILRGRWERIDYNCQNLQCPAEREELTARS